MGHLLRSIVSGFGLTVGGHLAREGIVALDEHLHREERQRRQRRLIALGVVACLVGLALLLLPIPNKAEWILGAMLGLAALAGLGVLLRPTLAAWRQRRAVRLKERAREREVAAKQARVASTLSTFERELKSGR